MANKVSIFITNTKGNHIELTNSKMALMMASESMANWKAIFGKDIAKHSVILSDFSNQYNIPFGKGYYLVEECEDEDTAKKIIKDCRTLLKEQYDRMMMIRVGKKYELDAMTLLKIETEYHDINNYEIHLDKYFIKGDKDNG